MRYVVYFGYAHFYDIEEDFDDNNGKCYRFLEAKKKAEEIKGYSNVCWVQIVQRED